MDLTQFDTGRGVRVTRADAPFDPALLDDMTRQVEERRGGVLSSGMEYPGRYSRWHMAYVDPCVELVARGRRVTATALNDRGLVLLPVIGDAMRRAGARGRAGGRAAPRWSSPSRTAASPRRSAAGGRPCSRRCARSSRRSPGRTRTSACTARSATTWRSSSSRCGSRHDRPADQRDLVLHLPDQLYVLDRKRETATCYSYDFEVAGASTAGLARDDQPVARGRPAARRQPLRRLTCPPTRRPGSYARRGGAGQGAFRARRPVRGGAEPRVPRGLRVAGRVLRAAAAAQPGAVRVLPQPGGGASTWSARRPRCTCG